MKKKLISKLKKLSTFDILGLFAILFITASVYLVLGRKTEYLEVTLRLFNQDIPEYALDSNQPKSWYIEHVTPGKVQKGALGEKLVEITDVYSYPNGYVYNDVYVTLRLKTSQNKITKQYIYEGSPLLIHDIRTFRIQDLLISGEVIDINQQPQDLHKLLITFELEPKRLGAELENNSQAMIKGVENYIADKLTTGMSVRDSSGRDIVTITDIKKEAGGVLLFTPNGMQHIIDPNRTMVTLTAEVLAEKINNYYFYRKEESLIVDDRVYLTFDKLTVIGKMISIEEIE